MPVANEEVALFSFVKLGYGTWDAGFLIHGSYQRYTNMTRDFDLAEPDWVNVSPVFTYTSTPGLKVHPIENNLDLREPVQKVDLPANPFTVGLTEELLSPLSVKVILGLIDVSDMSTVLQTYTVYWGQMQRAKRLSNGSVRLFCVSDKTFLERPLGYPAHDGCSNVFGGTMCQAFLPSFSAQASILQINGSEIVVTGPGVTSPPFTDYWRLGKVVYDGLTIGVAEYDQTVNALSLILRRRAPSSWLGQLVTVTAGCNKSRDHCRNRFSREFSYNGLGDFMPSRDITEETLP